MCINIRWRSVTIRETLQNQKINFVQSHIFGEKIRKIWKIGKLREKKDEKIEKKTLQ